MNEQTPRKEDRGASQQQPDDQQRFSTLSGNTQDFGELLRHELNNPLTGILGNAELLLIELRRAHIELPADVLPRLETVASLAVRMRETVRRLSEHWETSGEKKNKREDGLGG
jgi:signal transduction histidine kinase